MKAFFIFISFLFLACGIASCQPGEHSWDEQSPGGSSDTTTTTQNPDNDKPNNMKIDITINSMTFTATLYDNAAARAFTEMLPLRINMTELNGNEQYGTLPSSLPTSAYNPGTIHNGDIMLFGSQTLVIFYDTFRTSYSYTKIGTVDDPSDLPTILGSGDVNVGIDTHKE